MGDDYPYHIGTWFALPSRIDRIREMIGAKPQLSTADMKVIQNDQHSVLARTMNARIMEIVNAAKDTNQDELLAAGILGKWKDGWMSKDLVAPTVFETFYRELAIDLLKDQMGDALFSRYFDEGSMIKFAIGNIWSDPVSPWWDDVSTPQKETMSDIVKLSLKHSIQWLTAQYGADTANWTWGKVHTLTLAHPLGSVKILDRVFHFNRNNISVGGSWHTVSPYTYPISKPFEADHGSSQRHIFSLAEWDSSYTVIPTGNSGIPGTSGYCNQTRRYIDGIYHGEYFSEGMVKAHAKQTLVLKPN